MLVQFNRFYVKVMSDYRVTYASDGICLIARIFEGLAWFFIRVSNIILDLHYSADFRQMEDVE